MAKLNEVFSPICQQYLLRIYQDIFLLDPQDFLKTNSFLLLSPRVRNVQYKPVFCFVYFLITYFMIKRRMFELQAGSCGVGLVPHIESVELNLATSSLSRSGGK